MDGYYSSHAPLCLREQTAVGVSRLVVQHAERQGRLDDQSRHRFHHSARTTAVFGQFTDLSDVAAVADFKHVPRDDEALGLSVVGVEVDVDLGFGFGSETSRDGISGADGDSFELIGGSVLEPDEVASGGDAIIDGVATSGGVGGTSRARASVFDAVGVDTRMEELGRDKGQLTEIALEVVHGHLDAVGVGISVVRDSGLHGGGSLGVDEVGELTLEGSANDGFVVLELTSLLVDRGHEVLNSVFTELVNAFASAHDRRGRGAEVFTDRADGLVLGAVLGLNVGGGTKEVVLNPSRETAGAIRGRTIVDGGEDVRGKGHFHRTLKVDGGLAQLAAEFVLNTSDVEDVLRQVRHVNGSAEHVDVVFHFFSVAEGVLLEGRVGGGGGRVNVSTIENAEFNGGVGVAVNLPSERRISGFRTTLGHRGDGRVLGIDVGDEVREFFSDTDSSTLKGTLILELSFE